MKRVNLSAAAFAALMLLLLSEAAPVRAATVPSSVVVGLNRRLGANTTGGRAKDAPGLAVDPADARHLAEVDIDVFNKTCDAHASFDSGATWTATSLAAPDGYPGPPCDSGQGSGNLDGGVSFGSAGRVYAAFSATRSGEGRSVLVARSVDGGRSFATAIVAMPGATGASPASYGPAKIVVQRLSTGDRIFVAAARSSGAWVARSDDGGATWTAPVDAAGGAGASEITQPVITAGGAVAIGWRTTSNNAPNFIVVARSADGGATWKTANAAPSAASSEYPRLAADPNVDRVYVAYAEGPPARSTTSVQSAASGDRQPDDHFIPPDADVLVVRSADGGATWAGPVRVNDDPVGNAIAQRHPNVTVASDGRLDLVWHDRRNGYHSPPNAHTGNGEARVGDTYYSFSTDGGATFSPNHRVTDRIINNDLGLDYRCCAYWSFGPVSVPLGNDRLLVAWMDSREGNFDTDSQDMYLATVDLRRSGPTPVRSVPALDASSTSVALSRLTRPGGSEAVLAAGGFANQAVTKLVVVNSGDPAAISASAALARFALGPVLASPSDGLTPALDAEVRRMRAMGAFVLGDTSALSGAVVDQLVGAGIARDKIVRLAGATTAEVAAAVAAAMDTRSATDKLPVVGKPAFDAAIIANPATGDAFTASALSAALRLPYLFVDRDSIPKATSDALSSLGIQRTLVVGGVSSVSDAVAAKLPSPKRLGGAGPAEVSEAVAAESVARLLPKNQIFVADAANPVEGALLGSAAARLGGLLLAEPSADRVAAAAAAGRLGLTPLTDRFVVLDRSAGAAAAATPPAGRAAGRSPSTGGHDASGLAGLLLVVSGLLAFIRRTAVRAPG